MRYFHPSSGRPKGTRLPWPALATAMTDAGWVDLTHVRASLDVAGLPVALAGTDDPHLGRARYRLIAGPADASAAVRIGVIHSPEPALLSAFAGDGYDLVLAGHTHGGQVRVPFGPAIVTNCGIDVHRARWLHKWDERMWFHVCAGLGTGPYTPIRFACRPEASLLTLVARPASRRSARIALGPGRSGMLGRLSRGRLTVPQWQRGVAQLGSALRSGRRGRGFKSRHPDPQVHACATDSLFGGEFFQPNGHGLDG